MGGRNRRKHVNDKSQKMFCHGRLDFAANNSHVCATEKAANNRSESDSLSLSRSLRQTWHLRDPSTRKMIFNLLLSQTPRYIAGGGPIQRPRVLKHPPHALSEIRAYCSKPCSTRKDRTSAIRFGAPKAPQIGPSNWLFLLDAC